jgi:hypothetical protein
MNRAVPNAKTAAAAREKRKLKDATFRASFMRPCPRSLAISVPPPVPAILAKAMDTLKIGRISDEAIFYLMSRGISEEDAKAMIVSGFANPVSKELPLEYAVEMNNLIKLEMSGNG